MAKVRFDEATLYIIRSRYEDDPDEDNAYVYYQSPISWTLSPTMATIFRSYDTAEEHMVAAYNQLGTDGAVTEIAPLRGELTRVKQEQDDT